MKFTSGIVGNFRAKVLIMAGVAVLGWFSVFGQSDIVYAQAQTKKELLPSVQLDQPGGVTCRFASVSYSEGSVIQGDRVPEQLCVRAPNPGSWNGQSQQYHAEWVRLSKEARERSNDIVSPPSALEDGANKSRSLAFSCKPGSSAKEDVCACEDSTEFASGAMVRSDRGAMECVHGQWRPLVSCVAYGTEYSEGTVLRTKDGTEQMCVRVLTFLADRPSRETHLDWVRTSKELRERSNKPTVVVLDPVVCKPAPAKNPGGSCGCEGFSDFAPKSVMPSANGPIRCEDGQWKPVSSAPK